MSDVALPPDESSPRPGLRRADERLEADAALRDRLAASKFRGEEYARFAGDMAAHGLGVCTAWLASGLMFRRCAEKGRPVGTPPADWTDDDQTQLAIDTVTLALENFRRSALIEGGWSPDGKASLKTYFIGCCVLAFPNAFRSWEREREPWQRRFESIDDVLETAPTSGPGPEEQVVDRLELHEALSSLDSKTAVALALSAEGYSQTEIAEVLQVTTRAVEGLIYRHNRRSEGDPPGDTRGRRSP